MRYLIFEVRTSEYVTPCKYFWVLCAKRIKKKEQGRLPVRVGWYRGGGIGAGLGIVGLRLVWISACWV